jgi:hypothetical protein
MKKIKNGLRWWLAITSVMSFLGGWIVLAHSPKPIQPTANTSLAPIPTLPPLQINGNNNGFNFFQSNSQSNSQPSLGFRSMRTGGS